VLFELGGPTILGLIVFTFVLLATQLFRLTDLLVNRGVPFPLFITLIGSLLPSLLVLTMPMALLVGVLLGIGRLAADNEIVAMRTSGVNLVKVFAPVLILGVILAGGLIKFNSDYIPNLVRLNAYVIDQIRFIVASRLEAERMFKPETEQSEVMLHFRRRNNSFNTMEGITIRMVATDAQDATRKTNIYVSAREGTLKPRPLRGYMEVNLTSGSIHNLERPTSATEARYTIAWFDSLQWKLQLTNPFQDDKDKANAITTARLRRILKGEGESLTEMTRKRKNGLITELRQRASVPWACVAFVLLGVPLAIRVKPTGKAVGFAIAFGLIFFYYIMLKWGASLSQDGKSLGALIIFLPNIVISGVGVYLFSKILRQ
jgi:lipopolysaccharide export system permease protein